MEHAAVVVTDSGGIQEETTCLGIPCVTVRENTERPITVTVGTNILAGTSKEGIRKATRQQLESKTDGSVPEGMGWQERSANSRRDLPRASKKGPLALNFSQPRQIHPVMPSLKKTPMCAQLRDREVKMTRYVIITPVRDEEKHIECDDRVRRSPDYAPR